MFVNGEEIALRCDHILFPEEKFNMYPRLIKEGSSKFINLTAWKQQPQPIDNKPYIFVSTCTLWKEDLIECLSHCQNPFVLVCGTSDHPFIDVLLPLFEKLPRLQHIFTTNCVVNHPRIDAIPLGMANSNCWNTEHDLEFLEGVRTEVDSGTLLKDSLVYFQFSVGTNPEDRQICHDVLVQKGFTWDLVRPFPEYIRHLARHRFCICPMGNGPDTHRFWEALAVRCIPVCLHNPVVDFYAQYLPIIVLNSWEELTVDLLESVQGADWANADALLDVDNWDLFGRDAISEFICVNNI